MKKKTQEEEWFTKRKSEAMLENFLRLPPCFDEKDRLNSLNGITHKYLVSLDFKV